MIDDDTIRELPVHLRELPAHLRELPAHLHWDKLTARSRPTFDRASVAADELPRVVRLSDGPSRPSIIGIPSIAALSGPHQYLEFAKSLRNIRDLSALSVPGFVGRERLPAGVHVAIEVVAQAVQRAIGEAPVVLAGYSGGGMLAHGVASYLESVGAPVAAVVLIDTYSLQGTTNVAGMTDALFGRMFEAAQQMYFTRARLTAMIWYAELFGSWTLPEVGASTLLVQPTDPMPGMPRDSEWKSVWPYSSHDTVEVPGNHWTMMTENADSTAMAVEDWLAGKDFAANQSCVRRKSDD